MSEDNTDEPIADEPGDDVDREAAPKTVEIRSRTLVLGCLVVLLAIGVGVGAFFVGKGTGEDLDAARQAGAEAGRAAGAEKGRARGYKAGFEKGRKQGFEDAYAPAFKIGYTKAFLKAGLEAPAPEEIPVADSSGSPSG